MPDSFKSKHVFKKVNKKLMLLKTLYGTIFEFLFLNLEEAYKSRRERDSGRKRESLVFIFNDRSGR